MSGYLSMMGWAFLPSLATSWIQTIYYGITIRAGDPKPAADSPRYQSHRRIIHILVVTTYLLYTIYEADHDLRSAGSFYADLGVPFSAEDRQIKSRFRRLAAMHHPDKMGAHAKGGGDSTDYYMLLKLASETLQDGVRRFAYDRFGRDAVAWQKLLTFRDFVNHGLMTTILPQYAMSAAVIYVMGMLGYMDFGKYYRWLLMLTMCVFEVHTVMRPEFPGVVRLVNSFLTTFTSHPPYLPFQFISLARKCAITMYIAMSQIGPLLVEHMGDTAAKKADGEEKALQENLNRLEALTKQLDHDTVRLLEMEMMPYRGDAEAAKGLQAKLKEWLVQNTIRADPMVRDSLGTSLKKRRVDAPAGAKGTR